MSVDSLRAQIREVPDFPKPGILFYDITTLIKEPKAFAEAIELMTEPFKDAKVDVVVGMESRGFIFSAPMAIGLGAGFASRTIAGRTGFGLFDSDFGIGAKGGIQKSDGQVVAKI